MSFEENLNAATQSLDAAAQAYHGKINDIDARIVLKESEVDNFLSDAALHHPLLRVSPSQWGEIDEATGNIQGWSKNGGFSIEVDIQRTIVSGTDFNDRPIEDQEVLAAMGMHNQKHYFPNIINILRMVWSGAQNGVLQHTIWPATVPVSNWYTAACYSKLISGDITGPFVSGISDEWGLTGQAGRVNPNSYTNPHPYVTTESGEIHFALPAVALGRQVIDRNNPRWSWLPIFNGETARDTSK